MTPELAVAVIALVLNALVVPGVMVIGRILWDHERRITRCEVELNLKPIGVFNDAATDRRHRTA